MPLDILGGGGVLFIHGLRPDGVLGLLCVIAGIALLAVPLFVRRMTLRHYARRPDRGMVVSWEFFQDHISTKTEASSSTFEWRMISRVLQATEGFLRTIRTSGLSTGCPSMPFVRRKTLRHLPSLRNQKSRILTELARPRRRTGSL